jgi:hypothetical protein
LPEGSVADPGVERGAVPEKRPEEAVGLGCLEGFGHELSCPVVIAFGSFQSDVQEQGIDGVAEAPVAFGRRVQVEHGTMSLAEGRLTSLRTGHQEPDPGSQVVRCHGPGSFGLREVGGFDPPLHLVEVALLQGPAGSAPCDGAGLGEKFRREGFFGPTQPSLDTRCVSSCVVQVGESEAETVVGAVGYVPRALLELLCGLVRLASFQ